ncbi:MAG: hypothetical protein WDO73_14605 [Ignavibacteriota bacterium]
MRRRSMANNGKPRGGECCVDAATRRRPHRERTDAIAGDVDGAEAALLKGEPAGDVAIAVEFAQAAAHGKVLRGILGRGRGHMGVVCPQHYLRSRRFVIEDPFYVIRHRTVACRLSPPSLVGQFRFGLLHNHRVLPRHGPVFLARARDIV